MNSVYKKTVSELYQLMGFSEPEVLAYLTIDDAARDFNSWQNKAQPCCSQYWKYQLPVLHPYSYNAKFHLGQLGYQFDVQRKPNIYSCMSYVDVRRNIKKSANELRDIYENSCFGIKRVNYDMDDNPVEIYLANKFKNINDFICSSVAEEDPTSQVSEYDITAFYPSNLYREEILINKKVSESVNFNVNELNTRVISNLLDFDVGMLTFKNLVIVFPFNTIL